MRHQFRAAVMRRSKLQTSTPLVDPTSVPGLTLWLRADRGTFQDPGLTTPARPGDPVGGWADQSGQAHHATQTTQARRPTLAGASLNGLPALAFNGLDQWLDAGAFPLTGDAAMTVIHVFRSTSSGQGPVYSNHLWAASRPGDTASNVPGGIPSTACNGNLAFDYNYGAVAANVPVNVGVFHCSGFRYAGSGLGSGLKLRFNGAWVPATNSASYDRLNIQAGSHLGVGGILYNGGLFNPFQGMLAEFLCYARALTDTEIAQVESQLSSRYAIH